MCIIVGLILAYARSIFTKESQHGLSAELLNTCKCSIKEAKCNFIDFLKFFQGARNFNSFWPRQGCRLVVVRCFDVWYVDRKPPIQCWEPEEDHRNYLERKTKSSSLSYARCTRSDSPLDETSSIAAFGKRTWWWVGSPFSSILQERQLEGCLRATSWATNQTSPGKLVASKLKVLSNVDIVYREAKMMFPSSTQSLRNKFQLTRPKSRCLAKVPTWCSRWDWGI